MGRSLRGDWGTSLLLIGLYIKYRTTGVRSLYVDMPPFQDVVFLLFSFSC